MKNLIITLAVNGREDYLTLQKNLLLSIYKLADKTPSFDADVWSFNEYPDFCTPHHISPYKFKAQLVQRAFEKGFHRVIWLDSTMRLLKDPFTLFDDSDSGIVAFDNVGHALWQYMSDEAANNLRHLYNDLKDVYHVWGGAVGYDFTKDIPRKCLKEFVNQAELGSFNNGGSVRDGFIEHRHEQSCLSVIFNHYAVKLLPYGVIAAKKDISDKTYIQYGD